MIDEKFRGRRYAKAGGYVLVLPSAGRHATEQEVPGFELFGIPGIAFRHPSGYIYWFALAIKAKKDSPWKSQMR